MPAIALEDPRQSRSVLKLSLGVSLLAVATMVAAVIVIGAPEAYSSAVYTLTGGCSAPCNWNNPANWSSVPSVPGTYPGQVIGDTANVCGVGTTLIVNVNVPQSVIYNFNCTTATLNVPGAPATNSLTIEPSSTMGSGGNTITVNGGNFVINSGGTFTDSTAAISINSGTATNNATFNFGTTLTIAGGTFTNNAPLTVTPSGIVNLNGGTLQNPNTMTFQGNVSAGPSGTLNFNGGTLSGTGSTTIMNAATRAAMNITGANGAMTLSGQTINNGGTVTVSSASNPITLQALALLINQSGGTITLSADAPINVGAGSASIVNNSGATIQKTSGSISNISVPLNNNGAINVNTTNATIGLLGGGNHTGNFAMNANGDGLTFDGVHNFNAGATFSGASATTVTINNANGGTFNVNTGTGLVTSNMVNNGTLTFGGPQTLTLSGNYSQGAGGALSIGNINGPLASTNYPVISASGSYSLGGAIAATLAYPAVSGQTFNIIQASTGNSDFMTRNLVGCCGDSLTEIPPASGPLVQLQAVALPADVAVAGVSGSPNPVNAVQPVTWSISITNFASGSASNVALNISISSGTITSATPPSGFTCTVTSSTTASCTNPSWPANASGTVTVGSTAPAQAGTMTLSAVISTTSAETSSANNSGSGSVTVNGVADMGVLKTLTSSLTAGQNATYSILVSNSGPSDAANVIVGDTPGPGLTFVSLTGGGCSAFPCSLGTVATGSGIPLTATYAVASSATGTVSNSANVTSSTTDNNNLNNSSTSSNAVTVASDVKIQKTLVGSAIAGQNAAYQIVVSNIGPSDATGVTVTDTPGAGLMFVSLSGGGCTAFPCSIGTLTSGSSTSLTATYAVPSNASGTVSNTANVSSATFDSNLTNNSSTATNNVTQSADVSVTKSGPPAANVGSNVTFTITVTNNGPSNASNVTLADTSSRLSFVSATAPCSAGFASPCTLGPMTPGQITTVTAVYTVQAGSGAVSNTASVNSATPDSNSANNSATVTLTAGCPSTPSNQQPPDGATNQQTTVVLIWSDANAASYNVFLGPAGTGCMTQVATVITHAYLSTGLQPGTTYEWRVEAVTPGCPIRSSTCTKFTTIGSACPSTPPTLISPLNTTVNGPATFTWSSVAGAKDYQLFVNGNFVTTTTATSFGPISVANGPVTWFVIADFDNCPSLTSSNGSFNSCDTTAKTIPSIVAQSDSGQSYTLFWDSVSGATKYEVDEATDVNFTNPTTLATTGTSLNFQHAVSTPTAFFYRVRAFIACANALGSNSVTVRIVLSPVTALSNPNVSAPSGSDTLIPITVHIAGFPDGSFPFTASLDPQEPWLVRVDPSTGILPPEGINLTVFANPMGLPTGTHTGTVIVLLTTPSKGGLSANGVTPVGAPVSISLVTPVTPKPSGPPPANSLIIPSTGHLDGINSRWASDVRILNTSPQTVHYQITFTPDNVSQGVKQTVIETAANSTTALDDVVKTWYGVGSLGESSNGSLEIRPLDNPAKTGSDDAPSISFTTVASSRTYNAAPNSAAGTLGEFIPAILFQNFVGKAIDANHAATILSLQQIAQNDSMRTNFGVMEASGQPASVLVSVFSSSGQKLLDLPLTLLGGQHAQLNGFLAQNKISFNDGRIQVQVTGGDGKITAYASVIDNKSGDPVLVSGVPLGQSSADTFVLAGVADLNTGNAAWRTDMRIFNPTSTALNAQVTFYPLNGQGQPQTTSIGINPGEVKQLDNTLQSTFGLTNVGGAIHIQTATAQPLVVSGRTFNLTSNGTYGQLLNATTPADAIGKGDRSLQVLQVEDSVRERTNVGIFEVTGKPATVEVTLFLPDSKTAPSTQIPLPANGFMQIPIVSSFGFSNVYNARVSMRVVDGDGRVGAYGSVIDQITQAPTLIPAQKQ